MTRTRGDARAWLAWALAGGAVATASRNPLVLGLLLLVVAAVGLRLVPGSTIGRSWRRASRRSSPQRGRPFPTSTAT